MRPATHGFRGSLFVSCERRRGASFIVLGEGTHIGEPGITKRADVGASALFKSSRVLNRFHIFGSRSFRTAPFVVGDPLSFLELLVAGAFHV